MAIDLENLPYDDKGNLPRGESGSIAPPAPPPVTPDPAAEVKTDAPQPSPVPAPTPAPAEDKSGVATKEPVPGAPAAKAPAPEDAISADEEKALKDKHARPTDKGDEWRIRAYREGEKLKKQLAPVNDVMERIGSPDRARRGLELTADFADIEVPIANTVDKMTALSSSRFRELHDYLYNWQLDNVPDQIASDLVGEQATVKELQDGLALLRGGKSASAPPQPAATSAAGTTTVQKPEGMSDDDWADFQDDFPDAYKLLQTQAAAIAAKEQPKVEAPPDPKDEELKTLRGEKRDAWVKQQLDEIDTKSNEMLNAATAVVDQGLRDLGLEPDPAKDDERTIKLKERTAKRIRDAVEPEFDGPDGPNGPEDYSLCTEEQKFNRKLAKTIITLLANKDFAAAADYQDRLNAQVDLAFQRVADSEVDLYNAAMLQSTTPKPRDGTTAHTRPELVGGTAPAGGVASKTPGLDPAYRKPGETGHDAMMRYFEENETVPGR